MSIFTSHNQRTDTHAGFSLVEVVVVCAIIAVLAAIAIPIALSQRERASDAAMRADLFAVSSGTEVALSAWRGVPPTKTPLLWDDETKIWSILSDGEDGAVISSGSSQNQIAGTIWIDGSYCLETTAAGSENSLYYSSATKEISDTDCLTPGEVNGEDTGLGGANTVPGATPLVLPTVPGALDVTSPANNTINATWNSVSGATSYTVSVSGLAPATTTNTSYTASNVPQGTVTVSVRANNEYGAGQPATTTVIVTGNGIIVDGVTITGLDPANGLLYTSGGTRSLRTLANGSAGQLLAADPNTASGFRYLDPQSDRNLLINGDYAVWQRGNTFNNISADGTYVADRFYVGLGSGNASVRKENVSSENPPSGFENYAEVLNKSAGNSSIAIQQTIESSSVIPLRGRTVTLSLYARAAADTTKSRNLSFGVLSSTSTDAKGGSTVGSDANVTLQFGSSASTWQRFSTTVTVPNNATSLTVRAYQNPSGGLAINDGFHITGMQLEVSPTASPYDFQSYAETLAECLRYFERYTNQMPGRQDQIDVANRPEWVLFYTQKRVNPVITVDTPSNIRWVSLISSDDIASNGYSGTSGVRDREATLRFTVNSGIATYTLWVPEFPSGTTHIDIDAEI